MGGGSVGTAYSWVPPEKKHCFCKCWVPLSMPISTSCFSLSTFRLYNHLRLVPEFAVNLYNDALPINSLLHLFCTLTVSLWVFMYRMVMLYLNILSDLFLFLFNQSMRTEFHLLKYVGHYHFVHEYHSFGTSLKGILFAFNDEPAKFALSQNYAWPKHTAIPWNLHFSRLWNEAKGSKMHILGDNMQKSVKIALKMHSIGEKILVVFARNLHLKTQACCLSCGVSPWGGHLNIFFDGKRGRWWKGSQHLWEMHPPWGCLLYELGGTGNLRVILSLHY